MKLIEVPFKEYAEVYNADDFDFYKAWNNTLARCTYSAKGMIAGGSVRRLVTNTPINGGDIDMYNVSKRNRKLENILDDYFYALGQVDYPRITNASRHYTERLQLINGVYPLGAKDIFSTYDFSVCCFATDLNTIWGTEEAFDDAKTNKLTLNKYHKRYPRLPKPYRLKKYVELGYTPNGELSEMVYNNLMNDGPVPFQSMAGAVSTAVDPYAGWMVDLSDFGFNELETPGGVDAEF